MHTTPLHISREYQIIPNMDHNHLTMSKEEIYRFPVTPACTTPTYKNLPSNQIVHSEDLPNRKKRTPPWWSLVLPNLFPQLGTSPAPHQSFITGCHLKFTGCRSYTSQPILTSSILHSGIQNVRNPFPRNKSSMAKKSVHPMQISIPMPQAMRLRKLPCPSPPPNRKRKRILQS